MLLFGEGALLYNIFDWSFPNMKEKQEWVMFGDKPASNISASVSDLTIEHNGIREGKHGMNLFSKQVFKNLEGSELFVVHVKYIIYLSPWYYESMSLCHGIYIKEGIEPVILGTFITWYLPCGYFAEYIHDISH